MKNIYSFIGIITLIGGIFACSTNPYTGKKELNIIGDSEVFASSFQQYDSFLKENKVIKGTADAQRIVNIGQKIQKAAETYLKSTGNLNYLDNYKWEFNLVDDSTVNAWCMPGGKIVFYTGILPICQDDAGIATVMGHEVAHALLNHGRSRMQTAMGMQLGNQVLNAATSNKSAQTQQAIAMAYTGISQYGVMLPFGRKHETEADEIGLKLMALAGYNPENAIKFWERMAANSGDNKTPQWMSTHPSNENRISNIQKNIPESKKEAAKFGVKF